MKSAKLLLYTSILLLFGSCANFNDIAVNDVSNIRVKSVKGTKATIQLDVEVDNPTARKLYLKGAELDVLRNGYTFATLSIPNKLTIPSRSNATHTLSVELELKNAISLLSIMAKGINVDEFTASGYIKGGTCMFTKKLKLKNVSYKQLVDLF